MGSRYYIRHCRYVNPKNKLIKFMFFKVHQIGIVYFVTTGRSDTSCFQRPYLLEAIARATRISVQFKDPNKVLAKLEGWRRKTKTHGFLGRETQFETR